MLGFLIYIAHLPYISHLLYILIAAYAFIRYYNSFMTVSRKNVIFLLLLLIYISCSLINMLFHFQNQKTFEIPYALFIPLTFIIAYSLKKIDILWLVYLIVFESIIGLYELSIGVKTILPIISPYNSINFNDGLYNNGVFGLSFGSATYAMKLLAAIILLESYKNIFNNKYLILKLTLAISIILCLNRTVLVTFIIFELMVYWYLIKKNIIYFITNLMRLKLKNIIYFLISVIIIIFIMKYILDEKDKIINLFTRNTNGVDLSGRKIIWSNFLSFIKNHPILGNGSYKYYYEHYYSGPIHAHNSFIQIVANNGIILSIFYIFILFGDVKLTKLFYITPILIYSLAQYGIFWGISLLDILLFMLLFNKNLTLTNYATTCSSNKNVVIGN